LSHGTGESRAKDRELASEEVAGIRRACVEVVINGQLKGGGAFVRNESGKSYAITAAHLFPHPNVHCALLTSRGELHEARIAAYDLGHDLVLLQLDSERPFPVLPVAASTPPETTPLFNFGPALRRRTLVISGHVADSRISYTDFVPSHGYLAHFFISGINPVLTSGGIWVDAEGVIAGVQSGRLIGDEGAPSSGLSMASPSSAIRHLMRKRKPARTADIGGWVWEIWTADKGFIETIKPGTQGLVVTWLRDDGPLARAGVHVNDIILSVDGTRLQRRFELLQKIRSEPPGSRFHLEIQKPGEEGIRETMLTTEKLEKIWEEVP